MGFLINNYDYADSVQRSENGLIMLRNYLWQEYVKINLLTVCVSVCNNGHRTFPFEDEQYNTQHDDSHNGKVCEPINPIPNT